MKPFLVLFCIVGSSPVLLASHPWSPVYKSRNEFKDPFHHILKPPRGAEIENLLNSSFDWNLLNFIFWLRSLLLSHGFPRSDNFCQQPARLLLSLFLQHLPITTFSFLGLGAIHESGNYSTCTWEQDGQLKMWLDGSPSLKGEKKAIASTFSVRRANARSPKVCEIFCGPQKAANFCHTGHYDINMSTKHIFDWPY